MPVTLSVMGLYNYDNTILNPLIDAMPDDSIKDVISNLLLAECAEMEILYTNPSIFKTVLANWCVYKKKIWSDLWNTTNLKYNPINNYDRTENEEIIENDSNNRSGQSENNNRLDSSFHASHTENGTEATLTHTESRYGFNSTADDVPVAKSIDTPGIYSRTEGDNNSNSDTGHNTSNISENEQKNSSINRTMRNYGNIGVTTTQEMIKQEREIVKFDFTENIINEFKARFCIMVY